MLYIGASFDSCNKLLPAVTSCQQLWQLSSALTVISCCQLWQLLQAVASFDSSYRLSTALTALACFDSSYKLWQLLQAVGSYTSTSLPHQHCLNIWFHHIEWIHCRQLWQLLQLLQALPDILSRWQLNLNFISMSTSLRYLIPSTKVNSLSLQQGR